MTAAVRERAGRRRSPPGVVAGAAPALAAAAVVLGAILRIWALGRQPLNSDEAVVGLMAERILAGHFSAFYWGQRYGGGEPYVVAGVFAVLGRSPFTLGLTPALLDATACALLWRIGRRLLCPPGGAVAALLAWLWPAAVVEQSTLEYGFRWVTLCCGLGVLLVSLRLGAAGAGRRRLADWGLLGLLAGAGWWSSPEIGYFLLPVAVVAAGAALRHRRGGAVRLPTVAEVSCSLLAAIAGALPWIWANLAGGFASLSPGRQAPGSYGGHLWVFFAKVLPILLGVRRTASAAWVVPVPIGPALYGALLVATGAAIGRLLLRRRATVAVAFAVAFPFLYAASPFTWYWQDARYGLFLSPILCLLAASALPDARRGPSAARAAVAGAALLFGAGALLTLGAAAREPPYVPVAERSAPRSSWLAWRANPNVGTARLVRALETDHLGHLYAGYWLGYVVAFQSGGAVAVDTVAPEAPRDEAMAGSVEDASRAAWLFARPEDRARLIALTGTALLDPGCAAAGEPCLTAAAFEAWLQAHRVTFRTHNLGDFEAVVPERRVPPRTVLRFLDAPG